MHSVTIYDVPYDNVKTFHVTNDEHSIKWNVTPIIKKFHKIDDKNIRKFVRCIAESRKNAPKVFTIGEFIINKDEHFGVDLYKIKLLENGKVSIRTIKRAF